MIDARGIAFHALMRIDAHDAYSNIVLDTVFRRFSVSKRDRAFATEIVYGVLRNRGKLDWTLEQFSRVSVEKMDVKTRNILRLALYQVLFLDSVPAAVACNEAVELAKQVGHVGMARFVNGVMRALLRGLDSLEVPDFRKDPVLHISIEYSHPAWLQGSLFVFSY
jgi:16S rRNA (cytosine967-C5)-methyltransferase